MSSKKSNVEKTAEQAAEETQTEEEREHTIEGPTIKGKTKGTPTKTFQYSVKSNARSRLPPVSVRMDDRGSSTFKRSGFRTRHYQTASQKLARFMFTRKTYRIMAILLTFICILLTVALIILAIMSRNLTIAYYNRKNMNETIDRLQKNGLNVSVNCEYESDTHLDFYSIDRWNTDLCETTCGRVANAYRRNPVSRHSNDSKDCKDLVDVVKCHFEDREYCHKPTPDSINKGLKFCRGKNAVKMPNSLITGNSVMGLSVALLNESSTWNKTISDGREDYDWDVIQRESLETIRNQHILTQSLIVRCPKCMVSSRCFTSENKYRQLSTLRPGFPFYAQTCDPFEKLDGTHEEACPAL